MISYKYYEIYYRAEPFKIVLGINMLEGAVE